MFYKSSFFLQNIDIVIDSISKEHFKDKTNVGLSIGIIKNGVIQKNNYGGKYIYNLKDINNTTLFEIGSVTKLYTAFILASLEIENKINRFEFLAKYLPKEITKGKDWASKVRLVDLATHTSGFPQFENTESLINLDGFEENNPYGMFSEDFMLEILKETDTIKEYGEVKYSNFGIGILGYAMAKSENLSFSDLFTKYIIQGQNLKETHLVVPEKFLTDIAIPHRNLEQMPLIQLEGLSPSGSIKTSMSDLLNFLNLHIQKTEENQHIIELVLQNQLKNGKSRFRLGNLYD